MNHPAEPHDYDVVSFEDRLAYDAFAQSHKHTAVAVAVMPAVLGVGHRAAAQVPKLHIVCRVRCTASIYAGRLR